MQTAEQTRPTPERLMQFAWGYAPTLIIEAAVRHGVFDALKDGAKTIEELRAETGASPRGLRAVMNALVGFNLLTKENERYALTPESAAFLVSGKPGYLGGFFTHTGAQILPTWMRLTDVVREGRPTRAVNQEGDGAKFFEEFVEDLFWMGFPAAQALARELNVAESARGVSVLDLAAGSGVWSIPLAQSSKRVRVTAVDWEGVLDVTRRVTARHGVAEQYEFVAGDLSAADFGKNHDIATLGHILHSEGERRSRALLKKTFDALAPGGVIAIAEFLVNMERNAPPQGLIFAVNMLVHTDEGDTFSFEEIKSWLEEIGFESVRALEVPAPSPLILATKPRA